MDNGRAFLALMNDVLPCIIEMEQSGFCVDRAKLDAVDLEERGKQNARTEELLSILSREGFSNFNLRSAKQRAEYIYSSRLREDRAKEYVRYFNSDGFKRALFLKTSDSTQRLSREILDAYFEKLDYGLSFVPPVLAFTQTGVSVDKDTLGLARDLNKGDPAKEHVFTLFYEISRGNSFLSRYIDGTKKALYAHGDRSFLHTSYTQTVTKTGRLSSVNPNMQNWPRAGKFAIKEAIISRFPGGKIGKADESQIELRTAGWYYNDAALLEDYRNGIDIHGEAAKVGFGPDFTKEQRYVVKSGIVFRSLYWGSAGAIARDPTIPLSDIGLIQIIIDGIFNRYSGWNAGREADLAFVLENGYLDVPTGVRFKYDDYLPPSKLSFSLKNKVANWPIQHIAAAIIFCAMIVAKKLRDAAKLKSLYVGQVHDEIVADIFPGEEQAITEILHTALTSGAKLEFERRFGVVWDFPLEAEVELHNNWT